MMGWSFRETSPGEGARVFASWNSPGRGYRESLKWDTEELTNLISVLLPHHRGSLEAAMALR